MVHSSIETMPKTERRLIGPGKNQFKTEKDFLEHERKQHSKYLNRNLQYVNSRLHRLEKDFHFSSILFLAGPSGRMNFVKTGHCSDFLNYEIPEDCKTMKDAFHAYCAQLPETQSIQFVVTPEDYAPDQQEAPEEQERGETDSSGVCESGGE